MMAIPVSVIIVVKNGEKTIEQCLQAVQKNNPAEIIIVDGKSTDKTVDIARKYTSRIYSDEGRGVSVAHQIGAEQAKQKYISYVDSDVILPEKALATMLDELKARKLANIQAKIHLVSPPSYFSNCVREGEKIAFKKYLSGGLSASILVKSVVLDIGFDPAISLCGDDIDFLRRLKSKGYQMGQSSVTAYHNHPYSFNDLRKQWFWYGRGKARLIKKYGIWNIDLWPPLAKGYRALICLSKGKIKLVPYILLVGLIETVGLLKGFIEIAAISQGDTRR